MKRADSRNWSELLARGTDFLVQLAGHRGHVTYGQFNERICDGQFNLGDPSERDQLGRLLGDISRMSVRERDVMLSALVHHKGNPLDVGNGFFTLAIELGRLDATADDVRRAMFLGREIESVHKAYAGDLTATKPGTWHVSDPTTKVAWKEAVAAWVAAAESVLESVASVYGGSITYEQLAEQLFEQTGYRTRMLLGNWIGKVLGPVQAATLEDGKPPLSSLVIRAETGGVGEGYVNHQHPRGFADFAERQHAAAVDRLTCYRVYCDHVPEDAEPQMTALFRAKNPPKAGRTARPTSNCPTCNTQLPASGRCDYCT